MSYRISRARKAFTQQISTIVRTAKSVNKLVYQAAHTDYIFSASIFLAHAEIENYFSDVLSDLANLYSKHSTNSKDFPPYLRAHLLLSKSNAIRLIGEAIAGGSEKELVKKISVHLQSNHAYAADSALPVVQFSGADIYGKQKYPSQDNLEKVLARIGIFNAKANINRVAKCDAVSLLESLAALRTSLAHNASLPGISKPDIIKRISDCNIFVAALDRLLYENARSTHSANCWVQEMI